MERRGIGCPCGIEATARRRKIPKEQSFIGAEHEPQYVSNFLVALRAEGFLVVRVNACEAKENRSSHHASPDETDLLGIAKTLVSRRARSTEPATDPAAPARTRPLGDC